MGIIRDQIPRFEFSIPVAVIGAGACGLSAALAVRDAGVEVLVFERDERPWGSTSMSLGAACAAGSASQAAAGVDDSADRFVADILAKTEGRADAALARVIGDRSGSTIDWLATHQVPMLLDFKWTGLGHSKPRLHIPPGRNGEELLTLLLNACARAGAEVMTSARVVDLYADAEDRVLGLRIARPNGEFEEIGCEAVVIATCGFGADHAMVAENIPEMANAKYFGHEGNQGDGIRLGAALGGAVADMTAYQGLGTLADPQQVVVPHPLMIEGGFLVNAEGVRFTHELANISGMCVPVLAQPGGIAWVVFDARRHEACLAHSVEQRQLLEIGALRQADDWSGLERLCRLPEGSLRAANAEIDAARQSGCADRLGRSFEGLAPLAPPYFAVRVTGALFHTQGGLSIDAAARVLRADGRALPNVFAGGGAARGISGPAVTGYLPGAGLCTALTLGKIAGDSAAAIASPT
jgi:fumarate reductase flavoprotein subunit